ncbi:hypothetical protein GCM10010218_52600 [Streptomyces mashuensis]|uniref:Uncharacterized protein n=1 Tax=Streptomyces mashuensis TaxID=33904 RepID=A0A919B6S2_9ACTN|nr:hypothetical protein [Streptomyces mashuensis]GHF64508.1 hypothetical protein GCM10010218_52600 [Streptomyces mashuensis]
MTTTDTLDRRDSAVTDEPFTIVAWLLAGEDDESALDPHIVRGID